MPPHPVLTPNPMSEGDSALSPGQRGAVEDFWTAETQQGQRG